MRADLQPMAVRRREPGEYAPVAGGRAVERVAAAAEPLRGARVAHVSVAGTDAGVPEELGGLLSLAAGAGVEVDWRVLFGDPEARAVIDALHNGLRGAETAIADDAWTAYLDACRQACHELGERHDLLVLHDPGALGLALASDMPVVWRAHVDVSEPYGEALERAREALDRCALVLAPDESFVPGELKGERLRAAPPGIDPLDMRNLDVEPRLPGRVVRPLGVDLSRPFCLQVAPLDRWEDPHSVIEAYRLARDDVPELQLVIAGLLEDAASWPAAKEVSDYAAGDDDILLLTSYEGLGGLELGALQRLARTVLERSLGADFDLTPIEALWKRTPVIAGAGLRLQVRDGVDGYLTDDTRTFAERIVELVRDPGLAVEMGRAGRERVRERFLVTAALERELRALADALRSATVERS